MGDTIVAVASAPGRSARAVVRLSGPATREVLASVLEGGPRPWERGCFDGALRTAGADGRARSLPVLVCTYRAPASYTGEDAAEVLLPGNPLLVERIVAILSAIEGVRAASPGEFSARAYLNDRLTLDQAEGVAATIAAESEAQLDAARELLSGRTGQRYRAWAHELTSLLALVEAGIDFADQEDVVAIQPAVLRSRLSSLGRDIEGSLGAAAGRQADHAVPRVVLWGPPNAGKSTLFNALLGRTRAVVSSTAGTTRDVLEEELDLSSALPGAGSVLLADLAGADESLASPIDHAAQSAARDAARSADLIIYCDPAGGFLTPPRAAAPILRIRTKADLGGSGSGLAVCALDRWNLCTLRRAIAEGAWGARAAGLASVLPRHRRALGEVLERAREAADESDPALIAGALRSALDAIGELVGRISPDDVIGRIFATFCVGK
jgi:tRNA modification GTPase